MEEFSIQEMQQMQIMLQEHYKDRWEPICPATGQNKLLWMLGELGEVIDIIKKNGYGRAMTEKRSELVEEMADVLMYFNDIMLCYGVTEQELKDGYVQKFKKNMNRW